MSIRKACTLSVLLAAGLAQAQNPGQTLWRFDMDSSISGSEVGVGPDGTIYGSDNTKLYALRPDGSLRWTRAGVSNGTKDFLVDGTIVVGLGDAVTALNPNDGSTVWSFTYDSDQLRHQIMVGPSVGPDGNIYAVTQTDSTTSHGLGAFSLTPSGDLRWNDYGDPLYTSIERRTGPVHFTNDRAVFSIKRLRSGIPSVYVYDFNGDQVTYVNFTCTSDPRIDPFGRMVLSGSCGVQAVDTDTHQIYWSVAFGAVHLAPAIGNSGNVYTGNWMGDLAAVSPNGSVIWDRSDIMDPTHVLAVNEDIGCVVYAGGGFGVPEHVGGVSTLDGGLLWTVPLRTVGSHNELMWTEQAPLSPDGSVVYVTTRFTSNGAPGALYAIAIGDACTVDFNRDGTLDFFDVQEFLAAFAAQESSADMTGDGQFDFFDVQEFLAQFAAGCA